METGHDDIVISQDGSEFVLYTFTEDGLPWPDPDTGFDGWTAERCMIRTSRRQDATIVAFVQPELGSDGTLSLDFTPEIVSDIAPGNYRGDIRLLDVGGRPHYPIEFSLEIQPTSTIEGA